MSLILSLFVALMLPEWWFGHEPCSAVAKELPFSAYHAVGSPDAQNAHIQSHNRIGVSLGACSLFGFDFSGLVVGSCGDFRAVISFNGDVVLFVTCWPWVGSC